MKIVIDIPETMYDWFDTGFHDEEDAKILWELVKNGTPLPKEHRGIVDLKNVQWAFNDAILEEAQRTGQVRATNDEIANILGTVPTIIKAESEDSE